MILLVLVPLFFFQALIIIMILLLATSPACVDSHFGDAFTLAAPAAPPLVRTRYGLSLNRLIIIIGPVIV